MMMGWKWSELYFYVDSISQNCLIVKFGRGGFEGFFGEIFGAAECEIMCYRTL